MLARRSSSRLYNNIRIKKAVKPARQNLCPTASATDGTPLLGSKPAACEIPSATPTGMFNHMNIFLDSMGQAILI